MHGLDHHAHPTGSQHFLHRGGDLLGQPLLHLEPPGKHLHQARQLGEPHNLSIRDVGHVGLAEKRQQVMLAETVELDVADHHHVFV